MTAELVFSEEDINRNKPIAPGYYAVEIKSVKTSKAGNSAKHPGSKNYVVQFSGLEGPAKGVSVTKSFNVHGLGFFVPVFESCGIPLQPGVQMNEQALVGKQLGAHIINKDVGGRPVNDIDGYCPLDKIPGRV